MSRIDVRERMEPSLNMDFDNRPTKRMLGLLWDPESEQFKFKFKLKFVTKSSMSVNAKREVLSEMAGVSDPLDPLSPVILIAKYIMQSIRRLEPDWDDDLPDYIVCDLKKCVAELFSVASVRIPRCVKESLAVPDDMKLCVFSDASERNRVAEILEITSRVKCSAKNSSWFVPGNNIESQVFSEGLKLVRSGKSLAMSSPLICVSPFIVSVGILRVGGRLSNSSLSYDARHLIIFPSHRHVAKLVVREFHSKWWHASTERMLA